MKFSSKEYHIKKTKSYIKKNLFFFFNGVNKKSNDWIHAEQELQKLSFSYYKILNKISKKTLNKSIYINVSSLINSVTFILQPEKIEKKEITKQVLIKSFEPLAFILLAVKFNNKIYSTNQLSNIFSFKYEENKLLFFQFNITNVKVVLDKIKSK